MLTRYELAVTVSTSKRNDMNDSEMESILLKNGFTERNITHMLKIISRDDEGKETFTTLIYDLKKRFYAGCLLILVLLMPLLIMIGNSSGDVKTYFMVLIFGMMCLYYIIPMNLAWKSYRFLLRVKG